MTNVSPYGIRYKAGLGGATTVSISKSTKKIVEKLAKKHNCPMSHIVDDAIMYSRKKLEKRKPSWHG